MRLTLLAPALLVVLSSQGLAQSLVEVPVSSRNPAGVTIDFETASGSPPPGPLSGTDPYLLTFGLANVSLVNQPGTWTAGSDVLSGGSSPLTNTLCSVNGQLAIVAPGGALDDPGAGAGWSFQFQGIVTQFGFVIEDQAGISIDVEAYLGGSLVASLPSVAVPAGFPNTPHTFDILTPCDEIRVLSSNSTGGFGLDNIFIVSSGGGPLVPDFQVNTDLLALRIDGAQGSEFFPFVRNGDVFTGCASAQPASFDFELSSNAAGTLYDIAVSTGPAVGVSAGGFSFPGVRLNFDLLQPYAFLDGGPLPVFRSMPGTGVPGLASSSWTTQLEFLAPTTLTLQALCLDASAPAGLNATNAVQLDVTAQPVPTSIAGPTTGTTNTTLEVVAPPTCWTSAGIPFYGTLQNEVFVSPNGFLAFGGGGDTDTSPSVFDAQNDDGRVGFWTSFDPSEGGTVDVFTPGPDLITVLYNGVFYDGGGPACTFQIDIDASLGSFTISGLQGLVANPNTTSTTDDQWVGISPGLAVPGTTDPGVTAFALGGSGAAATATDMLYDFNDVSVSGSGLFPSIVNGLDTLLFTPDGSGNYVWAGF